jgi:hypothetical protein
MTIPRCRCRCWAEKKVDLWSCGAVAAAGRGGVRRLFLGGETSRRLLQRLDPSKNVYKGQLANILIATKLLRKHGAKADVVAIF